MTVELVVGPADGRVEEVPDETLRWLVPQIVCTPGNPYPVVSMRRWVYVLRPDSPGKMHFEGYE